MNSQQKLIESVADSFKQGQRSYESGITPVANYTGSWKDVYGEAVSDIDECISSASNLLSYIHDRNIDQKAYDGSASLKEFNLPSGSEIPKNTLMVFRNVVTTDDEDRDGDVLMPKGAQLLTKMPLLWQHMPEFPIGKMLAVDKHNEKMLRVFSVLLDMNSMTEDAAKLIEAEVLSISHGFIAKEWTERSEPSEKVPYQGFRITSYEIMEESLVSCPSNRQAIIDMHAKDQFKSMEMKAVGKMLTDEAPDRFWEGIDIETGERKGCGDDHIKVDSSSDDDDKPEDMQYSGEMPEVEKECPKCGKMPCECDTPNKGDEGALASDEEKSIVEIPLVEGSASSQTPSETPQNTSDGTSGSPEVPVVSAGPSPTGSAGDPNAGSGPSGEIGGDDQIHQDEQDGYDANENMPKNAGQFSEDGSDGRDSGCPDYSEKQLKKIASHFLMFEASKEDIADIEKIIEVRKQVDFAKESKSALEQLI